MFDGEIVNCDSLQLYRGFSTGTAKIPEPERAGIRHHMIDVLGPAEVYSAGQYARDARETIAGISRRGHLPIVVGGQAGLAGKRAGQAIVIQKKSSNALDWWKSLHPH